MPKPLPQEYEAQKSDIRSRSVGNGTFAVSVFTGAAWVDLRPVESDTLLGVTQGLTLQGGREGAYYWRDESQLWSVPKAAPWYGVPETRKNKDWQKPRYGLGQLVWLRHHPGRHEPAYILGAIYDQGDYSDPDYPVEPGWSYQLDSQSPGETVGEHAICDCSELSAVVLAAEEREAAADDFDPFLPASDDLP